MPDHVDVTVLLSSYNGEKYIEEQINSILDQENIALHLVVRDDGSTDSTPQILKRLQGDHANMTISLGQNVGVFQSFFALIQQAGTHSDFYALSDQDDWWYPDKLFNAVTMLRKFNPAQLLLYCSAMEYVNQDLQHLGKSDILSPRKVGFNNALVQNIATGCTIVLNQNSISKITEKLPKICIMHDWWMYLVVAAFGTVIYDPKATLKYRQHNQNVMGVAPNYRKRMQRRLARVLNSDAVKISTQLREFYRLFETELTVHQRHQIQRILRCNGHFFSRLRLLVSNDFHRQNRFDSALIRLIMVLGKF